LHRPARSSQDFFTLLTEAFDAHTFLAWREAIAGERAELIRLPNVPPCLLFSAIDDKWDRESQPWSAQLIVPYLRGRPGRNKKPDLSVRPVKNRKTTVPRLS
jgi:hypothetical protein